MIERELGDQVPPVPNWFLPPSNPSPAHPSSTQFVSPTPNTSPDLTLSGANEDEHGRPTKRRRVGSPEREGDHGGEHGAEKETGVEEEELEPPRGVECREKSREVR